MQQCMDIAATAKLPQRKEDGTVERFLSLNCDGAFMKNISVGAEVKQQQQQQQVHSSSSDATVRCLERIQYKECRKFNL